MITEETLAAVEPADWTVAVADGLARDGWVVVRGALDAEICAALRGEGEQRYEAGQFRLAAVGRADSEQVVRDIRSDRTLWFEPPFLSAAQQAYWDQLERLRLSLNMDLFLNLVSYECHFAVYPPGAHYARHVDQHRGSDERVVSVVAYLNADWQPGDGGELVLYIPQADGERAVTILPEAGTIACFLSDRFPHQVLPAHRQRFSVTAWLRRRPPGVGPL